ncbi:MAG: AbgT family transporter [Spirochaetaceae bacterium]|jgi:uncharacterized ion transporter superfamily protein YfcC|nr:AbgT family transporter [Spirochaetaceae bacterium]
MDTVAKKTPRFPHVYLVLLIIMVFVSILTYIIPAGVYQRVPSEVNPAVMVVDPNSYAHVEDNPVGLIEFFSSILKGFMGASSIIGTVLFAAGAIALMQYTGCMPAAIQALLRRFNGGGPGVIVIIYTVFVFLGVVGYFEASFPFIPVIVTMFMAAGYDRMTGAMLLMYSQAAGFTCGMVNPYSTGIAQAIIGLPMYSGIGYRAVGLVLLYVLGLAFLLHYANSIKKDPMKSVCGQEYLDQLAQKKAEVNMGDQLKFTGKHIIGLLLFLGVIIITIIGFLNWAWGFNELVGFYVILAIVLTLMFRINANTACEEFIKGVKDVVAPCLVIGLARSVGILIEGARVTDTMVYGVTTLLGGTNGIITLLIVFVFILVFDFFVSSASGKAVLIVPILSPIAQILGINQQVIVTMYHYADGIANNFWPMGCLAALSLCKISYAQWVKVSWKFFTCLFILTFGLVVVADMMKLGPF